MRKYILAATIAVATLTGCASYDINDRNTRILTGAAVGGVLGNVIGNGSTGATVGGAVVGGVIGANTGDRRNRDSARDRDYRWRMENCMRQYSHTYCERNLRY